MTDRQTEILQYLNELDTENPPDDPSNKALDLMEEFATSDELLCDLAERYAASPALHLVNTLTFCLHRRMFDIDPSLATLHALRIVRLHTCRLNSETLSMLVDLVDLGTLDAIAPRSVDPLSDLRKLTLLCLERCTGSNPPLDLWPTVYLLDCICEAGFLSRILISADQVYALDQMKTAFERHESSLDNDDLEKYRRIVSALKDQA